MKTQLEQNLIFVQVRFSAFVMSGHVSGDVINTSLASLSSFKYEDRQDKQQKFIQERFLITRVNFHFNSSILVSSEPAITRKQILLIAIRDFYLQEL